MARLNTRPSHQPSPRPDSFDFSPPNHSDQENEDPNPRRMDKGKGRADDPSRPSSLPTPSSEEDQSTRGEKRKRASARRTPDDEEEEEADEEEERDRPGEEPVDRDEEWFTRYHDPNQSPEKRRRIKRKLRKLERDFQENREDILREPNGRGLSTTISRATKLFRHVKQTHVATLDSRLLVNVSGVAYKKAAQLVLGDTSTGIDVDEFLSKCITFMRNGGPLEQDDAAQPQARRPHGGDRGDEEDDEHEDDASEALDWGVLGRYACYPHNARPAVPSFLLGPLSVEKKQRKETQRRARNARDVGRESRPEELTRESLQQSDESGLTAICTRIHKQLIRHSAAAEAACEQAGITSIEELGTEKGQAVLRQYNFTNAGGVSLFHFALNPNSFGQTVENLFYISFLIKEGSVGISFDNDGVPTLSVAQETSLQEKRQTEAKKHQAVLSLDYSTWRDLIEAYAIDKPMIEHREEDNGQEQVQQSGWYT